MPSSARACSGQAPAEVRLLYLREPLAITAVASEQTIRGQRKRAVAVWTAIERACDCRGLPPQRRPPLRLLQLQEPPAPPSRALTMSQMTAIDEAVDAAFEPLRGNPQADRAAAVAVQPGRLRAHLGRARRLQGAAPRPQPPAGRRGARRRRLLLADREPGGEGGGRARTARRPSLRRPCGRPRAAASRAATPSRPSAPRSSWPTPTRRPRPTSASPRRWPPAGCTCGRTTRPTSSAVPPIGSVLGLGLRPFVNLVTPGTRGHAAGAGAARAAGEWTANEVVLEKL